MVPQGRVVQRDGSCANMGARSAVDESGTHDAVDCHNALVAVQERWNAPPVPGPCWAQRLLLMSWTGTVLRYPVAQQNRMADTTALEPQLVEEHRPASPALAVGWKHAGVPNQC